MEFDEMKKIWDTQNNEPIYGINQKALHARILSKKKKGNHITNISELLCILTYTGTACFIIAVNLSKQNPGVFMYILSAWMLVIASYLLIARIRRINGGQQFDRSLWGDLTHAISIATYQVRLSSLMRWNIIPIGVLVLLGILEAGKPVWIAFGILIFFILSNYAAGWEHNIYKTRKRELEALRDMLGKEDTSDLAV